VRFFRLPGSFLSKRVLSHDFTPSPCRRDLRSLSRGVPPFSSFWFSLSPQQRRVRCFGSFFPLVCFFPFDAFSQKLEVVLSCRSFAPPFPRFFLKGTGRFFPWPAGRVLGRGTPSRSGMKASPLRVFPSFGTNRKLGFPPSSFPGPFSTCPRPSTKSILSREIKTLGVPQLFSP